MGAFTNNLRLFILAIGAVLVWRGVWGLSDLYLFPDDKFMSYVISVVIGLVILSLDSKKLSRLV